MRHLLKFLVLAGWVSVCVMASEPCPQKIRPWLVCKPGTTKLISTINGSTRIFTIDIESPENGLWLKEVHENRKYICISFICDSDSDIIFVLDKTLNKEVRLNKHFQYYSLHGLIDPNFLVISQEEISSDGDENFGYVVLRLSDLKLIRVGKDGSDYQLRVEGDKIVGTKTVKVGEIYDQVPYSVSIKHVLGQFK